MLESCGCNYAGLGSLGDASSDFEALNNAIVRAAMRGGGWAKLNTDWQDRVVDERTWKIAIPPLWSSLLEEFWTSYGQLYRAEKNRTGITNPYDVAPSGIAGAIRDLYAPTVDTSQNVQRAIDKKLAETKAAAIARAQAALREAGKSVAEGTQQSTTNWGVGWLGIAIIGAVGYYALQKRAVF